MSTIRSLTVLMVLSATLLTGGQTAQKEKEVFTEPKDLSGSRDMILTSKTFPKGIYPTIPQREVKTGSTGVIYPPKPKPNYRIITVHSTAYTARCEGCTGYTYVGGKDVRYTTQVDGMGVIAVDPAVIPYGSLVEIDGKKYKAWDKGGAINGHEIDILVSSTSEALNYGSQNIDIKIFTK